MGSVPVYSAQALPKRDMNNKFLENFTVSPSPYGDINKYNYSISYTYDNIKITDIQHYKTTN
jgi:hypothetical protein